MDTPSAEFAEEPRALDVAYDDYVNEVGPDAVAAQFAMTVESVNARKLNPQVAFFLFDRQADLHKAALEVAAGSTPRRVETIEQQVEGLPGLPRMVPMTQRHGNWIDPLPPRRRDEGTHNAPVM